VFVIVITGKIRSDAVFEFLMLEIGVFSSELGGNAKVV
jgi:hypothetical protein